MARPPASEQVQVNFRMPADLKARIEAAAQANSRSTTAEIVASLEEKYPAPEETAYEMAIALLDQWSHLLDEVDQLLQRRRATEASSEAAEIDAELKRVNDQIEQVRAELRKYFGDALQAKPLFPHPQRADHD